MKNISIVGIGKLGLCFALTLEKHGYIVRGLDVNQEYINQINEKTLRSSEPSVENYLSHSKNFTATTDLDSVLQFSDFLFVIVATPSLENGRYDHSQIDTLITELEKRRPATKQKHFIVCCTVMPGYCDSIKERLNKLNYTVSYNPEFIAQGTIIQNQSMPDMVLIGEGNTEIGDILEDMYKQHTMNEPRVCRMSPLEAEITKISLNCFLTTKIAYANMVGDIVQKSGCRPEVVLKAIGSDSRIGVKYLGYGYGYGGPCFPRDNRALAIYAEDIGLPAKISKATDDSNALHSAYQVESFTKTHDKKEPVVFNTVTYKPESTLLVESQQLRFAVSLAEHGYKVIIREREEVIMLLKRDYHDLFDYETRK